MQVTIDLTGYDAGSHLGGFAGWPDEPVTAQDDMAIALDFANVQVRLSYGQFHDWLNGLLRWRFSIPSENGPVVLTAEHPPPDWEAHVEALERDAAQERESIAAMLEDAARSLPAVPAADGGGNHEAAYRRGLANGRSAGLLDAALRVREHAKRLDLVPPPAPPAGATRKRGRKG